MEISDKEFKRLVSFMYSNYGINLQEKRVLVSGRLQTVITKYECENFEEYFDMIHNDPTMEMQFELINRLTTNHTFFAREEAHFQYMKDEVLPYFTKQQTSETRHPHMERWMFFWRRALYHSNGHTRLLWRKKKRGGIQKS